MLLLFKVRAPDWTVQYKQNVRHKWMHKNHKGHLHSNDKQGSPKTEPATNESDQANLVASAKPRSVSCETMTLGFSMESSHVTR